MKMEGVTEYCEGFDVELIQTSGTYSGSGAHQEGAGRWVIRATNEGGHDCTEVDVVQLIAWLRANRPDLLKICEL